MINRLPSIAIITPSYNQGEFIKETINSVLCQDYSNLELIVMDGGSQDETLSILKSIHDKRLRWTSKKDKGQSQAINNGMKSTSAEIVAYLNSDDKLEQGSLKTVGKFFLENPQLSWLVGKSRIIDQNNQEILIPVSLWKEFWLSIGSTAALSIINFIPQPSAFWRRKLFKRIGYFDEQLFYAMDYDFWLRLSKTEKYKYVPKILSSFRMHPGSKTGIGYSSSFKEALYVSKKYGNKLTAVLHSLHDNVAVLGYKRFLELT